MIVTWIIWGSLITENETCWWFTKQNSEALAVMKQVVFHTTLVCPLLLTSRSKNNMCLNVKLFPQYFQWLHCSPFQLGWVKSQWVRVFTLVGMCSHFPFFLKQGKNELTRVSKMIILTKHLNATIDYQRNFKLPFFSYLEACECGYDLIFYLSLYSKGIKRKEREMIKILRSRQARLFLFISFAWLFLMITVSVQCLYYFLVVRHFRNPQEEH